MNERNDGSTYTYWRSVAVFVEVTWADTVIRFETNFNGVKTLAARKAQWTRLRKSVIDQYPQAVRITLSLDRPFVG